MDQFFSYTGHGSYSNSLTAWVPEAYNLREQMPGVFDKEGRARFMRYCFTPYPKNDIINMIKRSDLDLAIFHEHGLPDRQYFSDIPETSSLEEHIKQIKASRRKYVRNWTSNRNLLEKSIRKLLRYMDLILHGMEGMIIRILYCKIRWKTYVWVYHCRR